MIEVISEEAVKVGQRVRCPECAGAGYTVVGGAEPSMAMAQAMFVAPDTGPRRPVICRTCHGERTAQIAQVK